MHGNVLEWCQDFYGEYDGNVTDPTGAASGDRRCLRGGSLASRLGNKSNDCSSASRHRDAPAAGNAYHGFRAALNRQAQQASMTGSVARNALIPTDAKEFGGHYYKLFEEKLTWHEARKRCEEMEGHLVTITSAEEAAIAKSLAVSHVWIGLFESGEDGQWKWVTGEPVIFTDWAPNQPDDVGNPRSVVWLWSNAGYKWDDTNLLASAGLICEWEPPTQLTLDLGAGVTMELVYIKPGTFTMGGTEAPKYGWQADERPKHQVTITKGYYLGKYEVTQVQWEAVMGSNPSRWKGPDLPVEQISWEDCQGFLNKLNEKAHKQLKGRVAALPTEAQWEYACRAETKTRWAFGENEKALEEHGWFNGNSKGQTHSVGQKNPNGWGLYDMHGNVWEWCQDWVGPYAGDVVDPTGPPSGEHRFLRGGCWLAVAFECRSAFRNRDAPTRRGEIFGFRVALR